ncbi:MAG TPA: hypothetical protein PLT31_04695 [Fibrobacteraceae bacterium]|jgi:MoxR-like ATPase|nr:hypothetical protein [Fibrobacter sp.]HOG67846.1 hypothetical protein [Fibrobacteraceae bacterium]HPW94471.1 hypothetical protein [Fibrobacteraceae bacterium]
MDIKTRISELLRILSNDLFDRESIFELTFLALFTEQPVYIFGRSGSGKNIIAKRAIQMFRDINVLTFAKRYQEIPKNLEDYQIVFFQGFDSKNPLCNNFVNITIQEKSARSLIMTSKERPEASLAEAGIADQVLFILSLPEIYSVNSLQKLLKENFNINNIIAPVDLLITKEEQIEWLKKIQTVELSDDTLKMIGQIAECCNENQVYVSIQKWLAFSLIIKTIAFFNGRSQTNITDTFFLGTPIWIRKAQNETITTCFKNSLTQWLYNRFPLISNLEESLTQLKQEVEHAINSNGDVYETILFNNIECIQYSITVAGESIPLYTPAAYIGTNQEFNPFNELKQKEKRVICNFMGDNVCRISIDSSAKKTGLRATTNASFGKTFEPFAKLPARVLRINDEEKIKKNKAIIEELKQTLVSTIEKNASAMIEFKELYKEVKNNKNNLFLNTEYFNYLQEAIHTQFSKISEHIQILKSLQESLMQKK